MTTAWMVSTVLLWCALLVLAFFVIGALRALGIMNWRLDQLEVTRPGRVGRSGLKPGRRAPDFTLPGVEGGELSLRGFLGRSDVLLVFVQPACRPCQRIVPELNRLQRAGTVCVLSVSNGCVDEVRSWAHDAGALFPVLVQEDWSVSKRFEIFATPFAFLINPQGVIVSSGIVNNRRHLGYVLDAVAARSNEIEPEDAGSAADNLMRSSDAGRPFARARRDAVTSHEPSLTPTV
jgi:methylamine dehydrogenase accessory protein MauD